MDHGLILHRSATAVAAYKITTLEVLTFTDDFTCKALIKRYSLPSSDLLAELHTQITSPLLSFQLWWKPT